MKPGQALAQINHYARIGLILLALSAGLLPAADIAAQPRQDNAGAPVDPARTAPVAIDGEVLFYVRGVSAFSAERRAQEIRETLLAIARDHDVDIASIVVTEGEDRSTIMAGDTRIMMIFEVDAEIEGVQRPLLAQVYRQKIVETLAEFRSDRSPDTLLRNGLFALGVTGALILLAWAARALFRWLDSWVERHVRRSVQELASRSRQVIQAGPVWGLIRGLLRLLRLIIYFALAYLYLNTVLGLFPWSRPFARILFDLVLDPLESLWQGLLGALPDLLFLVVLWIVVRYVLKVIRVFFRGVGNGRIRLENFDADWAEPTYKIVRVLVIAFSLVIAYPYIPGSDSAAFKGVSVFIGVLLSLGSSSFIANMIAGLSMTYRRAFRVGDIVKVGETVGRVEEIKLMITRLRTAKSESVILPNSAILNTEVVNYSQQTDTQGLIIHTTVSIGYDTPWRQIEALLLEAAARTPGLKRDPAPFVLQLELGKFAVRYQVNGYWDGNGGVLAVRSALHANIQDVFNEHGVQIMSPAYENDPAAPKVVPPERWHEAPAKKPG